MFKTAHCVRLHRCASLLAVGTLACQEPVAIDAAGVGLEIEGTELVMTDLGFSAGEVTFAVTNGGSAPIYLPHCNESADVAIERWASERWVSYQPTVCHSALTIKTRQFAVGERLTRTAYVLHAGRYRIILRYSRAEGGALVDLHSRDFQIDGLPAFK